MAFYNVNSENGNLIPVAGGTLYADTPIGTIISSGVSASTPPAGYLYCDGRAVSRTTYAALFAAIGTAFGAGDGSTTFNLPDFRETVPVGAGENNTQTITNHDVYTLGQFKDDNLGKHDHPLIATTKATYNNAGVPVGIGNNNTPTTATHGKQLGVNYFIKAIQVAVPADLAAQLPQVIMPDYARGSIYTTASASYTCTEDCYVVFSRGAPNNEYRILIDGNDVCAFDSISTNSYVINFSGYVKKGSTITSANNTSVPRGAMKVFGLA